MTLKMVLPKGRIYEKVNELLGECGIRLKGSDRNYRPQVSGNFDVEVKLLKSQNIPTLLELGQHDIGFAGLDWILEQEAKVETLLDLQFDPVKIVCAIPENRDWKELKSRRVIAVSEYKKIACDWLDQQGIDYTYVRAFGATEVFPPEDGDLIIDNTSTGNTLVANQLKIVDTIMQSSTYFIANQQALLDPGKRQDIETMLMLFKGVIEARSRVLLEMNCPQDKLQQIVNQLPSMNSPTVAPLYNDKGFSVKAAILKSDVNTLIPRLIASGASDLLETPIRKVI
jgi:ATP phosphoribosyltransferase